MERDPDLSSKIDQLERTVDDISTVLLTLVNTTKDRLQKILSSNSDKSNE